MRLLLATVLATAVCSGIAYAACDTPMARDVKIESASSPEQAKFLGIWSGTWSSGSCAVLAVKKIDQAGNVALIWAYPAFAINRPNAAPISVPAGAQQLTGHLANNEIKFVTERGTAISFRLAEGKLLGSTTFAGEILNGTWMK